MENKSDMKDCTPVAKTKLVQMATFDLALLLAQKKTKKNMTKYFEYTVSHFKSNSSSDLT